MGAIGHDVDDFYRDYPWVRGSHIETLMTNKIKTFRPHLHETPYDYMVRLYDWLEATGELNGLLHDRR